MKVRVLIATTEGPVEIEALIREPEQIEESFVVLPSDGYTKLPLSRFYNAFVSRKTGVVGRLYDYESFRMVISSRIDDGFSWQLGFLIAHALEAADRLCEKGDPSDMVVLATGEVGWNELQVKKVGYVERKITLAIPRLMDDIAAGRHVLVVWPKDNSEDAAPKIDELHQLGMKTLEVETGLQAFESVGLTARVLAASGSVPSWAGSPFRGLQAFEASHRAVFFGRGQAREEALERLRRAAARDCAFLLIYGLSGSGKSSLARAGLVGDVVELAGSADAWRTCLLTIGRTETWPVATLSAALIDAVPDLRSDAESLAARLRESPRDTIASLRSALDPDGTGRRREKLILLVDQFEDLFLWAKEQETSAADAERESFVVIIEALARSGVVWVIATLRSDLLPLLDDSTAASRLATDERRFALQAPSRGELREIVARPAEMAGIRLEGAAPSGLLLPDVFVEAANANPASLPLLQFALERLYEEEGRTGCISYAGYERIGGIEGAIGGWADKTAAILDRKAGSDRAVDDVLLSLGRLDRDGGRVVARRARMGIDFATPERREVVNALQRARLVSLENDGSVSGETVRVSHEALLTHWPRARKLFDAHVGALELRDRVNADAEKWIELGRDESDLLHPGRPLTAALDVQAAGRVGFSPAAIEYIQTSAQKAKADSDAERKRDEDARAAEEARRNEREIEQAQRLRDAQAVATANKRAALLSSIGLVVSLALAFAAVSFSLKSRRDEAIATQKSREAQASQIQAAAAARAVFRQIDKARKAEIGAAQIRSDDLDTALAYLPAQVAPYFRSSRESALEQAGNIEDAVDEENAILDKSPGRADILGVRAYHEILLGSSAAAARDAKAASEINNDSQDFQNLALADAMQGHYADAEADLDAAIKVFKRPTNEQDALLSPEITAATHLRALNLIDTDFQTALRHMKMVLFAMSGDARFGQAIADLDDGVVTDDESAVTIDLAVLNWAWLIARGQAGSEAIKAAAGTGFNLKDFGILAAEGALWERCAAQQTSLLVGAKRHYLSFLKAYDQEKPTRYAALAAFVQTRLATPALSNIPSAEASTDDPRALALSAEEAAARTSATDTFEVAVPMRIYTQAIEILDKRRTADGKLNPSDLSLLIELHMDRGNLRSGAHYNAGTREDADAVIALDPQYADAYRLRATVQGDAANKEFDYRKAIALDQSNRAARSSLAELISDKDPVQAVSILEGKAQRGFLWGHDRSNIAKWKLAMAKSQTGEARVKTLRGAYDSVAGAIALDPDERSNYELRRDVEIALGATQTAADLNFATGLKESASAQVRTGALGAGLMRFVQALQAALAIKDQADPNVQSEVDVIARAMTSLLIDQYDLREAQKYWKAWSATQTFPSLAVVAQRELKRLGGT